MLTTDDIETLKKLATSLKYAAYRPPCAMSAEDAVRRVGSMGRSLRAISDYGAEAQWHDLDDLRMCADLVRRKGIDRAVPKAEALGEKCDELIGNLEEVAA